MMRALVVLTLLAGPPPGSAKDEPVAVRVGREFVTPESCNRTLDGVVAETRRSTGASRSRG